MKAESATELSISPEARDGNDSAHVRNKEEELAERTKKRLVVQYLVSRILADSLSLKEALSRILETVCTNCGWDVGAVWWVDKRHEELWCTAFWQLAGLQIPEFAAATREQTFKYGEGLPGHIWAKAHGKWIPNLAQASNFPRGSIAAKEGLQSGFGFAIRVDEQVVGIIEFFSRDLRSPDENLLQMTGAIGNQVGQFIQRKRVEDALRSNQALLEAELADTRLLQEISATFIQADNVEALYVKILDAAVAIMHSGMASMQVVDEKENALRLLSWRGFPPDFGEIFKLVRPDARTSCCLARQTGQRAIIADVETCDFVAGTPSLEGHRKFGIRAAQSTPLISRGGKLVGIISTHWRTPHQPSERDLRLLDILARQAADLLERRQAEEARRETEARLQAILENSTTVIYAKDTAGRYLLINSWFEKLFHVKRQEIIGKTDLDVFPEPMARKFRENDLTVIRTGEPLEIEEVAPHDDGPHTYISIKFPLRGIDGTIHAVTGISTDITSRKRGEEASQHLAAIVESSDDAIISKDLNGIITTWNAGAERVFGYTAAEMIGKPVMTLVPADRHDEETTILQRLRNAEPSQHFETVRRHKNGSLIDVSLTVSAIRNLEGKLVGASKIARDISERKRLERQQRSLYELVAKVNRTNDLSEIFEEALTCILECQGVGRASILLCEADGVMRLKAWRGLSETCRLAVEGHSPWKPDDPDPQPVFIEDAADVRLEPHLREVLAREEIRALAFIPLTSRNQLVGNFIVYYDEPHKFSSSETRPVQTVASQVALAIERHHNAESLERVVDERTASLRAALSQLEEFSYTVSHDLRAPLRAMHLYTEVLLQDFAGSLPPRATEYLSRIAASAGRLDKMILDVLTFIRAARNGLPLEIVCLDKLVRQIVEQYPGLDTARIHIAPLSDVSGHEASLTQAISNLLSNAVKFVPPNVTPEIRVWTESSDADRVRLWIADNGIGVPPKYQHRLFGMFERVHSHLKYEGTGVGLAIVRKAVERMGGTVGLESDGVNGSRFWIELQAADRP